MYRKAITLTATVAAGGTESGELELRDYQSIGISTPAVLTSTAITCKVSAVKGGTKLPLYDSENNLVSLTVTTARAYGVTGAEADALAPWNFVSLVCGSAEAAGAAISVVLK